MTRRVQSDQAHFVHPRTNLAAHACANPLAIARGEVVFARFDAGIRVPKSLRQLRRRGCSVFSSLNGGRRPVTPQSAGSK